MNNLRKLRQNKKLSIRELAEQTGFSYSHLSMVENNKRNLTQKQIEVLTIFFGVSSDYLLGYDVQKMTNVVPFKNFKRIPILNRVTAGDLNKDLLEDDIIGFEYMDVKNADNYFYLVVSGDSMSPTINDGDLILVNISAEPRNKDIVVAGFNGSQASVKRLKIINGEKWLFPDNPNYDPVKLDFQKEPYILGKVERVTRKF